MSKSFFKMKYFYANFYILSFSIHWTAEKEKRKRTEQDVLCPQKYGSKNRKEFYFLNYSAWLETALDSSEVLLSEEVLLETEEVSSASEETLLSEEAVEVP